MLNLRFMKFAFSTLLFSTSVISALIPDQGSERQTKVIEPVLYASGHGPVIEGLSRRTGDVILTPEYPVLTLDYGSEVVGVPYFTVSHLTGPTQVKFKFTEEFKGLNNIYGDGPWTFSNGLSNTFRTETFNITQTGQSQSYFLQGGQRWQTIELLTNTSITFTQIGFKTNNPFIPNDQIPGSFNSSNDIYNQIWGLGALAVQASCVDNASLASTWEITSEGALIRGQAPAQSMRGVGMGNYTMSFMTKIIRGGTGWRVASGLAQYGPYFVLTSNYPEDSTFIDTDSQLLPPNSLIAGYGWSLVNQTTLPTSPLKHFAVNTTINEDQWYEITTAITTEGFMISINGTPAATINYEQGLSFVSERFGPPSVTSGTWGFGPFQDQIAFVKDVEVRASNGSLIYENQMKSSEVLTEYGVAPNNASVCLDGPKRDRLVWIGDFVHTARTIAATTYRLDHIWGTIEFELNFQVESGEGYGLVPTAAPMGVSSADKATLYPSAYGITDYQMFFLVSIGDYYHTTGDIARIKKYWNQTKILTEVMLEYVDPVSGLIAGNTFFFTGPSNGTAVSSLMVIALQQLVEIATALNDTNTIIAYQDTAAGIRTAVNHELWNEDIGTYSLSMAAPTNFSAIGIAFAIRAGISNATQTELSLAKLPLLKYGCGYINDDTVEKNNSTQLSPNIYGFVLESLFIANTTMGIHNLGVAKDLLDNFWSLMVTQNEYYTGATWEYLLPDGSPGLELFTSLSHPWGSAPSYLFEEYVLGIKALDAGYKTWQFQPLIYGLDLEDVQGVVPTPFGNITASWAFDGSSEVSLVVEGPSSTHGVISLPFVTENSLIDGKKAGESGARIDVQGGQKIVMNIIL
ncbi:RhaA is able to hydrolyze alpha-1 [Phlyctema vagabunda]|uniref:RhaA is able to hydrolyze alpha-1 n=1 Tax=Phlyctema vagabunda TaxID=108571 RepID=A0ABR4PBI7_9HELO